MRLLGLLAALPLSAAYVYFFSDNFAGGISSTNWYTNGTISGGSSGLTSTASGGGSVIYKPAIPDGSSEYEVKANITFGGTGGVMTFYGRASNDALDGTTPTGSYYAFELTPTVTGSTCTLVLKVSKRVSGVNTILAQGPIACKTSMTVRFVQRNGWMSFNTNLGERYATTDSSITSGKPGVGARQLAAGSYFTLVELGPADRTAPSAVVSSSVRSAIFDTRVDLAWQGAADDTNGSGIAYYQVNRGGPVLSNTPVENIADTTVTASSSYAYVIYAFDFHGNYSAGTTVNVTTAPAGMRDPRKTGVRPLGTYWGASPENIDLQSGNLSFSLPTVTAQGRGGSAVPLRLSYNSQNWRKDPGGVWKIGNDVGFGFGWKMLAGSITPVYSGWWVVNHYLYTDSTGAEYRLCQDVLISSTCSHTIRSFQ